MHLLFLQKCFREGLIDHPPLYSCHREELVSRIRNEIYWSFFFFYFLDVDGGAFVCVLSFLPVCSNCPFSFFDSQITEHLIACMSRKSLSTCICSGVSSIFLRLLDKHCLQTLHHLPFT